MSIGSLGIIGGLASTPLSQPKGAETDRAQQAAAARESEADSAQKAEMAAEAGATQGADTAPQERDADGRRPWEINQAAKKKEETQQDDSSDIESLPDPNRPLGNTLDLSG